MEHVYYNFLAFLAKFSHPKFKIFKLLQNMKPYFLMSILLLKDHYWCKEGSHFSQNNRRQTNILAPFQIQHA